MTRIAASTTHRRPVARRIRRAGALAAAAVLALIVWAIAVPFLGVELVAGSGAMTQSIGPIAVAVAPLLAGGIAWGLLAVLEKLGDTGRRIWLIIGAVVLALSLVEAAVMATSAAVMATLLIMHVVVGATLIAGLAHPGAARVA